LSEKSADYENLGSTANQPGRTLEPYGGNGFLGLAGVLAILLFTTAVGLWNGQKYGDLYVFGYIMAIVYALRSVRHGGRQWSDIGIRRGFVRGFKQVWYYFGADAVLFQIAPPTLGIAYLLGYYPDLLNQIAGRLYATDLFGTLGVLLVSALVLTFMEELVFRATIQERLSWFIGTPAAILCASLLFGLVHAIGATGSLPVVLLDVAGVALDGVFFGIIYARTHNLALTWATHYTADVVGALALAFVL
jgi:membrane protease YdiL (CAAX protease family)